MMVEMDVYCYITYSLPYVLRNHKIIKAIIVNCSFGFLPIPVFMLHVLKERSLNKGNTDSIHVSALHSI